MEPARRVRDVRYAVRDVVVLADQLKAQGKRMLYLNIGDPNPFGFAPPAHMIEAVKGAMDDPPAQDIAGFFTELSGLEAELQDSGAVIIEERELTPEDQAERDEVLAFHERLEEMTHEEVLGVSLGADSAM